MKSYIKIYGPPVSKAIEALRKIALDFPEVCIMDTGIQAVLGVPTSGIRGVGDVTLSSAEGIRTFFGVPSVDEKRCNTLISKSKESLGEFDFYYEWFKKPSVAQIQDLIIKIDEALASVGVRYTITTK